MASRIRTIPDSYKAAELLFRTATAATTGTYAVREIRVYLGRHSFSFWPRTGRELERSAPLRSLFLLVSRSVTPVWVEN